MCSPAGGSRIHVQHSTIISQQLIEKLSLLGTNTSLCNWILDFLTGRPQSVRIGNSISSTTTLSTGAPQGCVLIPLLFTLLTHDCAAMHKFADDTTVVDLIRKNNESAYREEVKRLTAWCTANNLSLNVEKTKAMVVDFRRAQSDHSRLNIDGSNVEIIKSTRFLGVHLVEDLTWSLNTSSITKKAQQRNKTKFSITDFNTRIVESDIMDSKVNLHKLNQQWRSSLRQTRAAELREDFGILTQSFERVVDCKDNVIKLLMSNLSETEQQSAMAHKAHLQSVDHLLELQKSRLAALESHWNTSVKELSTEYNTEREQLLKLHHQESEYLKAESQALKQRYEEIYNEARQDYEYTLHRNKIKYAGMKHAIESTMTEQQQWHLEEQQKYMNATDYETNDAFDLQDAIEQMNLNRKHTQKLQGTISALRSHLSSSHRNTKAALDAHLEDCEPFNQEIQKLKARLSDRPLKSRLANYSQHSYDTINKLQNIIQEGEELLRLVDVCHKLETEQEKVLPFCTSSSNAKKKEKAHALEVMSDELAQTMMGLYRFRKVLATIQQGCAGAFVFGTGEEGPRIGEPAAEDSSQAVPGWNLCQGGDPTAAELTAHVVQPTTPRLSSSKNKKTHTQASRGGGSCGEKREEHRVTYKSGGRRTQVDYILCRRGNLKEISDCKVFVGEIVARQHRMVVCRMTLMVCKKKRSKIEIEKKTKWWKLKKEECCEEFRQKLRQVLGGQVVLPDDWETTAEVIRQTGRKVLGVSSGRRKEDKETWWWNEEVQDSIQRKRLAKKKWDMDRTEENRQEYKELQCRVKREVSKAKQKAYDELYTRLDTREGEKDLYRLDRQRDRDGKDVQQVRVIKDRDGRVLTSEESVQRRWKEYFEELMNEENEREKRVEGVNSVEQKVDKIRKDEVRKALKLMKSGKAVGPDDIPVEVWKCLGEAAVEFVTSLFNRVLESERMPEEWRRSVLVPIFKNKGDVQSCSNYRGIKLMSHTMKLWERVVEARLRKVVEICEQQYGFMPRKSTTDAIFSLRILMEKYRDGQMDCVFFRLRESV
ncbi:hypothetical protein QTP86_018337 [Hemibagrus guttatus]|nr:hypothetical protein QTP86_018337 [Hemibagrus guttatus]